MTLGKKRSANGGSYTDYTLEDRVKIGKYTAETANNMYILGESAKYCSCHIFPTIHIDMSTDIIVTAKIYICQYTHVLQRCIRL